MPAAFSPRRRLRVAVLFGGASPEHDVSVITAQQVMDAADAARIAVIPVHLGFDNRWRTGPGLRDPARFRPVPPGLREVGFAWGEAGPEMRSPGAAPVRFDAALPAFHGAFGEDGRVQATFELLGIPVTGFSAAHSAIAMRKDLTKTVAAAAGVPVLPHVLARRDGPLPEDALAQVGASFGLPVVVKPASLGSSIGVGLAKTGDEVLHLVAAILRQDSVALIEPQVQRLTEYNIAVMRRGGAIRFSAIERPRSSEELLDFREKYLSGSRGGAKGAFRPSEGMLSLTRDIEPDMDPALRAAIRAHAATVLEALGGRGAPRLDFMVDGGTGELWFNEINPIPGSYGFFLWEAAPDGPLLFSDLIDHLLDEALADTVKGFDDPVPQDAWLLQR